MWIPIIISFVIILVTSLVTQRHLEKNKLQKSTYKIVRIIGVYIPAVFMIIYYSYMFTDTIKDNIIVMGLIVFALSIIVLSNKYLKIWKLHWLISPCVMILVFLAYQTLNFYALNGYESGIVYGIIGGSVGTAFAIKLNKRKLISSVIAAGVLILIVSGVYRQDIIRSNKPFRYAIEYAQDRH